MKNIPKLKTIIWTNKKIGGVGKCYTGSSGGSSLKRWRKIKKMHENKKSIITCC